MQRVKQVLISLNPRIAFNNSFVAALRSSECPSGGVIQGGLGSRTPDLQEYHMMDQIDHTNQIYLKDYWQ